MSDSEKYVPNILVCGDKTEIISKIGARPFNLVGEIKFSRKFKGKPFDFVQDGRFWFNGKVLLQKEFLPMIQREKIDHIVFPRAFHKLVKVIDF